MRDNAIAVCGDKDSVLAFKAIGLDVFCVDDEYQARDTIHALARKYSVIFVTKKLLCKPKRLSTVTNPVHIPSSCRYRRQRATRAWGLQA